MMPPRAPALITATAVAAALGLAACGFGEEGVSVSKDDPNHKGAVLFATHCSGCHTLSAAGTQGSGNRGERTQGPNLDQRTETYDDALFAIQNGGFSGAIMPAEHRRRRGGRSGGPLRRQVRRLRSRRIAAPRRDLALTAGRAMLDLKLIRSDPERVKAALARRGAAEQVDELLELDARRRELLPQIEGAQAERKTLSKQIGEAKQARRGRRGADGGGAGLKERSSPARPSWRRSKRSCSELATALPNLPDPDAPDGMTEEDAVVLREVGEPPELRFRAARPPRARHRAGPDRHGGGARGSPARASPT